MSATAIADRRRQMTRRALSAAPILLFAVVVLTVGLQSDRFLTTENAARIVAQAAPTIVVAVGMTFVLLTAGVDLSVGALMFIGAGLAGHLALAGGPFVLAALLMMGVGIVGGVVNGMLVTRLGLIPFIATLATLYIGRGTGRWITETRAINLPEPFLAFGASSLLGAPTVVWVAAVVALAGQFVLSSTPFGRQLYALGENAEAARKAGLDVGRLTAAVYTISGGCAGLGGLLALSRLGAVSPRFGELYEFDAITAAVLGGTSLYGGRGRVFPGTVVGALLLTTIFSALVTLQADPYVFPLITAAIIFVAVLVDTLRARVLD
jgi:ribose transport system permease protein